MKRFAACLIAIVLGIACGAAPVERKAALDSSPCRLPIGGAVPGIGGFLSYPEGQFASDRASALGYSAKHRRWLAAPRQLVSPDGDSYIPLGDSGIYRDRVRSLSAVDIATGAELPLGNLGSSATAPLAWSPSGIYFMKFPGPELWVFDWVKKNSRLVAGQSIEVGLPVFKARTYFNGGAAWTMTAENTSGPNFDILVRVDLASGRAEEWSRSTTSTSLTVLGFSPEGNPLVWVGSDRGSRIVLLTGPGRSSFIESGDFRPGQGPWNFLTDSHGLWLLAHDGGIWLYRDRTLRRIGSAPLPPPSLPVIDGGLMRPALSIAGPCVSAS